MPIFNFNNCAGQPRQLYRIRYGTSPLEEERELYLIAFDYRGALDMFPPFYTVTQHNPADIPPDVSEEDHLQAMNAVRGIDRIADVVLALR